MSRHTVEVMSQTREDNEWRYAYGISKGGRVLVWSELIYRSKGEAEAAGRRFLGLEGAGDGRARVDD